MAWALFKFTTQTFQTTRYTDPPSLTSLRMVTGRKFQYFLKLSKWSKKAKEYPFNRHTFTFTCNEIVFLGPNYKNISPRFLIHWLLYQDLAPLLIWYDPRACPIRYICEPRTPLTSRNWGCIKCYVITEWEESRLHKTPDESNLVRQSIKRFVCNGTFLFTESRLISRFYRVE